ncbi:MAG: hypothetical protein WBA13_08835 [Microcoleaceae cyanobacterium]
MTQSTSEPQRESQTSSESQLKMPSDWLIGFATAPILLLLGGGKVLADAALDLSQTSEEVFRGDRLPVLKFPQNSEEAGE